MKFASYVASQAMRTNSDICSSHGIDLTKALASSSLEKREWRGFHSQGLVNEVTVAALVTALVTRLEGKLDGAEPGHRHVRNKDQSGTTTSGNLVGAAIRPRNLGANLKAKIQEGRNGVTSSNYWKQLLF
ncbi:hypothetical protein T4A_11934, partial [Trichinella pseudospiralis]